MSLPLAQLNTLLGLPLVTGRLVGGMKALPEGILVGLGTPNLIHRTLGTKTRDSAETCNVNLSFPSFFFFFAWFVLWLTLAAAMFVSVFFVFLFFMTKFSSTTSNSAVETVKKNKYYNYSSYN
jgi:hypothetical protein